jgi:hypothetical protein
MGERNLCPQAMKDLGDDMAAVLDGFRAQH